MRRRIKPAGLLDALSTLYDITDVSSSLSGLRPLLDDAAKNFVNVLGGNRNIIRDPKVSRGNHIYICSASATTLLK